MKILLVNPDYYSSIFSRSRVRAAISRGVISLGLASLAASLMKDGHQVKIVDMNVSSNPANLLREAITGFRPYFIGVTSTTPLIKKAYEIAAFTKKIDKKTTVLTGGPHPSALPEEVLAESAIDCVVKGEGEFLINRIVLEGMSSSIPNIFYKKDGKVVKSERDDFFVADLDSLPYPAYELFDIKHYHQPGISSRRQPVGYLETSRGCYGRCVFCNKNIHGYKVRMKSCARVVDEMERMLKIGFKEIQIIDDIFTADMVRAASICEEILRRRLNFFWYPRGGIRVDRVNPGLLELMKRSGCYRIPFGIESGSQRVIDEICKGITLEQAEKAVAMAKRAGLETECYFMLGLPTETKEDIEKTIDFSIRLNPDYVKFAIALPLPGTPMFDKIAASGRIKTTEWDKYTFSTSPRILFDHDVLSWKDIERYDSLSYRKFYFRPDYIFKMVRKTVLDGTILDHLKAFLTTRW
jgi:anaerobic magnesium-protoporphyrin IX monomethyl ester cyclase